MTEAFLRSGDDFYDGTPMQFPGEPPTFFELGGLRWFRQDIRCGTARWIEFWEDGYRPPGHEVVEKPTRGRKQ